MKQLSISERSDIGSIIRGRHHRRIRQLSIDDPDWKQRVEDRKRKVAIGRLKVQKEVAELESLESQIRELNQRRDAIQTKIDKKMPLEERRYRNSCPGHKDLCSAIGDICEEIHEQEMAKDKTGKLKLQIEQELHDDMATLASCVTREDVVTQGII